MNDDTRTINTYLIGGKDSGGVKTGSLIGGGGGGGLQPKKKPNATANFKFGTGFFRFFSVFFGFFRFFFGFSILANFDWFNGFLLSGSFC